MNKPTRPLYLVCVISIIDNVQLNEFTAAEKWRYTGYIIIYLIKISTIVCP